MENQSVHLKIAVVLSFLRSITLLVYVILDGSDILSQIHENRLIRNDAVKYTTVKSRMGDILIKMNLEIFKCEHRCSVCCTFETNVYPI